MAHKGKWAKICGVQKNQECIVSCDIGYGKRTLKFSRNQSPYCGAWKNSK